MYLLLKKKWHLNNFYYSFISLSKFVDFWPINFLEFALMTFYNGIVRELLEGRFELMKGKVKWFNNEKGFGFIEYKENEDIFVHYSSILSQGYKTLVEGQYVEFELVQTDKGLQAKNVVEIKTALV